MSKQKLIIAVFVWVAATGTATSWAADITTLWQAGLQAAPSREAAGASRQAAKARRTEETLSGPVDALVELVGRNKELFGYGAIAGFGILMMGLAIGSASSHSKSRTQAQMELLRQEKEKAENLAKLKAEFLNQVSHELRTPLAVIIGYIECITDGLYGDIEVKHLEILQVVAKQSTHLKNMIDQILIYSRLEAGKQPIRIEELDLSKVLKELKDTFEFLCKQKGLVLHWEPNRDSLPVRSDATRLKEVISNLLQNAVKYTDHGSITLRVAKLSQNNSLAVEVEDTGVGISDTHVASIFEPFMQVHKTSTEHSRGGIGLGLSIVRRHLEQIHGTISVKSELGKGSTFRIVLPLNFDKQKSRSGWLLGLGRSRSRAAKQPMMAPRADARTQEAANTTHAVG
jgi:signal transduction histidine kinase